MSIGRFALLLLRSLASAAIGMLLVTGAALAHGGAAPAQYPAIVQDDATAASLPDQGAATPSGAAHVEAMQAGSDRVPCNDGPDHHSASGGCCCSTACHSAVEDTGTNILPAVPPAGTAPVVATSVLHGRPGDPGDRPPRTV